MSPEDDRPIGDMEAARGGTATDEEVVATVREIMTAFARRTGLADAGTVPRRYLWTDAFAVCDFLELHRATGEREPLELALRLVEQVHGTLGRHRPDDPRTGWISGLSEEEGRAHPTRGGLRIGKPGNERGPGEPLDERSEWDRDGQYFHYLTRWMHALARVADVTGEGRYLTWAVELALGAFEGFARRPAGAVRGGLCWKMSIDLSRPLVPSTGQHDPLDGLLTFQELRIASLRAGRNAEATALEPPIEALRAMCAGADWATADPLGIGGLLGDAYRLAWLSLEDGAADAPLLPVLVDGAVIGLAVVARTGALQGPAARRLAFRELGLAIGLHAAERLLRLAEERGPREPDLRRLHRHLEELRPFLPLAEALEAFWLDPASRATDAWRAHEDIDAVMLATSLLPDGFLAV